MSYEQYKAWKETPLTTPPYLSVIIPAYNEEERIIPTIGAIASHVSSLGFPWEMLIADDGSKDMTVPMVEALGFANLRVLKTPQNRGKGSAVRRGMLAARGEYLLFADADNSTPIEELDKLLTVLRQGKYDVAVGSRAADGAAETNKSLLRRILSGGLRWIVQNFFRLGVRDTQCGFKLFTREVAKQIYGQQTVMGFSFDLEVLYLARKFGYKIVEVPVTWIDAPGSKVDTRKEAQRFLETLAKIKLNDLRGQYQDAPREKMRLAVITAYPPSRGSLNEYAHHFVEALKTKPDLKELILLVDEDPSRPATVTQTIPQGQLVTVPAWRFNSPGNAWRIARTLRQYKPDAVLFNIQFASFGSGKLAGGMGLLAPWLSKLLGFPTIVLLHNILETVDLKSAGFSANPLTQALIRFSGAILTRMLLAADRVALTIPKYVEIIRAKYRARNVILIPHGTFDDIAQPNLDLPEGPMQIMTFGKFGTYKKVETLIEAFQLLQTRPNAAPLELVIAGTDSPNAPGYLASAAQTYGHVPHVRFTGYVAEAQVPSIFGDAAVVVFPYTSTTGSSGVLHQAGSFGKAVVLPHIGDFVELISEEGYAGEVFEPEDAPSLADAMARVLDDPEHRQQLGMQNYLAARGVPIAEVADWYLLHFRQLIQPKKKAARNARPVVSNQPGKA